MTKPPEMNETASPEASRGYNWAYVAKTLRAHPGQWFELKDAPKINPTQIRRGYYHLRPAGSFNASSAGGMTRIAYVGEPIEPWDPEGLLGRGADERRFEDVARQY